MAKKKVFVSFDFDNDKTLKEFLIGQAKNADSPFEVSDFSLKEEAPEAEWEKRAKTAIARSDVFIVMLGKRTRFASGVLKEVRMANGLQKPKFQIIGYSEGSEEWAVPNAGRTYKWSWETLKTLLA